MVSLRRVGVAAATVALVVANAGCGASDAAPQAPASVKIGYFPNLTHAVPVLGLADGHYAKALGDKIKIETATFNAGGQAIEALFSGAVDATYIGPSPTINGYAKSQGSALRVIAGAASGGAFLVVKPEITSAEKLRGKTISSPAVGNTQDVALRHWLKEQGFATTKEGSGDVKVLPQENAQIVDTFQAGTVDGAWVPEPHASKLVAAGGKVLVDERDLWPGGKFVTTQLIVRTDFLNKHPDTVRKLLEGHVGAVAALNEDPAKARQTVGARLTALTGKPLPPEVAGRAWSSLTFLNDPLSATLLESAKHAADLGLLEPVHLDGLYDLTLLNVVLKNNGLPEVAQP